MNNSRAVAMLLLIILVNMGWERDPHGDPAEEILSAKILQDQYFQKSWKAY